MAYTTLPGVRITVANGFTSAADATTDATTDRTLIVARAAGTANSTVLRDPSRIWKNESDVISAFGRGSDVHVAFSSLVKGGAANIFISATNPTPAHTSLPADIEVAEATLTDITQDEYELYLALEHASLCSPSMIVSYGYAANASVDNASNTRLANYARIITQKCEDLTLESSPCFAVMSLATFEDYIEDQEATKTDAVALGTATATQTVFTDSLATKWVNAFPPVVKVDTVVQTKDKYYVDYDNASVTFFVAPGTGKVVTADDVYQVLIADAYSGTYPVPASTVGSYVTYLTGSTASTTAKPHAIQYVLDSIETTANETGLSKFLVLIFGDVLLLNQTSQLGLGASEYIEAAGIVAGSIYRLDVSKAITMEPLQNVTSLAFDLTPAQKLAIINKGVIPLSVSPRGLLVSTDGVSAAIASETGDVSVYNRLINLVIAHTVVRGVRSELEPFVGLTASTARLNSIETKLRSYFLALKQNEVLKEVVFEMKYSITTSTLTVVMTIKPFGEFRDIDVTVDMVLE